MHLHDSGIIAIWLAVFYAIWAATEAGDPGYGQFSFFIVGLVLTFVLNKLKFENTIEFKEKQQTWKKEQQIDRAKEREKALDYNSAIEIWEKLGEIEEAVRVRKLKVEQGTVKVTQKVVHGDEVTKTEIKDSVVSKSNIGSGGDDKLTKIKELKELHDAGAIDDDEFKQMKKEILGK